MHVRALTVATGLAAVLSSGVAFAAGSVEGTVTVTKGGQPASAKWTLVHLEGFTSSPSSTPATVSQQGRTFIPPVTGIVKGEKVSFLNDEPTGLWHHVFSPGPVTLRSQPLQGG